MHMHYVCMRIYNDYNTVNWVLMMIAELFSSKYVTRHMYRGGFNSFCKICFFCKWAQSLENLYVWTKNSVWIYKYDYLLLYNSCNKYKDSHNYNSFTQVIESQALVNA